MQDLKEQREGEAHIFFKSKIIRARMFYANPQPVERMRINHFLKVEKPIGRLLVDLEARLDQFSQILENGELSFDTQNDESEEIQFIANQIQNAEESNPIERSVTALLGYHNRHAESVQEEVSLIEEEFDGPGINIFRKINFSEDVKRLVGIAHFEQFSEALIHKAYVKDKAELIERVLGRTGAQSRTIANEIVKDMLMATEYPPGVEGIFLPVEMVIQSTKELADYVATLKNVDVS